MPTREEIEERARGTFPELIGVAFDELAPGAVSARLPVRREHLAPNGFLHAGAVVGLADTACGFGCALSLPGDAVGFTTVELKANFLATARDGEIACRAEMAHGGRTTQVWDATVTGEDGKTIALFRCTQLVLYPRP